MALDLLNKPAPADLKRNIAAGPGEADYRETGNRMAELLNDQGWCMIRCVSLNNETIVIVVYDGIIGYPPGYPVYTSSELDIIASADPATMQLLHEAKKEGALIQGVEDK